MRYDTAKGATMSETEISVPMDDRALFDAATSDAAPAETPAVEQPEAQPEQAAQDAGPARDEHGRFAPKTEQPAQTETAQPEQTQQPDNAAQIPAWRVAEIAAARREAEAKATELERRAQVLEQQNRQFQHQLQQFQKPATKPDMFENPDGFVEHGVRQALDPVQQRMDSLREHYSWRAAVQEHGKETAHEARKWFYEAVNKGDQSVGPVLQRAMQSIDPFEEIVGAFKQHKALSTVGTDPNAWFEKELARRRAEDPQFAAQFVQQPAQQQQPNGQGAPATNIVKLPPSLNRQPGSAGNAETGTMADGDLYAFATR
jgi:hypothetical protein